VDGIDCFSIYTYNREYYRCRLGNRMHIIENYNAQAGRVYCYVSECLWDKHLKKYVKPRISVGHLSGEPPAFIPNKNFTLLLVSYNKNTSSIDAHDKMVIETVKRNTGIVPVRWTI